MRENPATVLEAQAAAWPDQTAVAHGEREVTWGEFEHAAALLAGALAANGIGRESKVGICLHNCPEYLVAAFAAFKLRAVPMNLNYRYRADELAFVLNSTDTEVVFVDATTADVLAESLGAEPSVRLVVQIGGDEPRRERWTSLSALTADASPAPVQQRSGDDLAFVLTGGTTGMPKAVMWRCEDFFGPVLQRNLGYVGIEPALSAPALVDAAREMVALGRTRVTLPASPLMHGLGFGNAMGSLLAGGSVVLLPHGRFDAAAVWRDVARHRVTQVGIVGDAFGIPLVEALEAGAGEGLDLSCLERVVSAGAALTAGVKRGFLKHLDIAIFEGVGSTEAPGVGMSRATRNEPPEQARFKPLPHTRVVTDDGRRVEPGSAEVGRVLVGPPHPLGYYKDAAKTAELFTTFEEQRYIVTGDFATIDADGAIVFLGRGSTCINTGGEKVFPEEVEAAVKRIEGVRDCIVVGLPHERWGQQLVAVVSCAEGASLSADEVKTQVREGLADYKVPKEVVFSDEVPRKPNGKADHAETQAIASAQLVDS